MLRIVAKQVVQRRHGASERQGLVKSLSGSTLVISLHGQNNIEHLTKTIEHKTQLPTELQCVSAVCAIFNGRRIDDDQTSHECGSVKDSGARVTSSEAH